MFIVCEKSETIQETGLPGFTIRTEPRPRVMDRSRASKSMVMFVFVSEGLPLFGVPWEVARDGCA